MSEKIGGKYIGEYWVSAIRRTYLTYDGEIDGDESIIWKDGKMVEIVGYNLLDCTEEQIKALVNRCKDDE